MNNSLLAIQRQALVKQIATFIVQCNVDAYISMVHDEDCNVSQEEFNSYGVDGDTILNIVDDMLGEIAEEVKLIQPTIIMKKWKK